MKVLLLGKNGQVGWELQRSLSCMGELIALDRNSVQFCGDMGNLEGLAATLRDIRPDVIVNAAAYTAVDKAEVEKRQAYAVNALAPELLAQHAAASGALLVHYSTDYVFDGTGSRGWCESDLTAPLNAYGRTKLEGEQRIQNAGASHLIFRTSWVYGSRGGNFAKTMLCLGQERRQLTVINDQFGAPTGADFLADATAHCIRQCQAQPALAGLYHMAAAGETTWFQYANYVFAQARVAQPTLALLVNNVAPVNSSTFKTAAIRPLNSRLDTRLFERQFRLVSPPWQRGIDRLLSEIL